MGISAILSVLAQLAAPPTPAPKLPIATAAHGRGIEDRPMPRPPIHPMPSRYFSITDGITSITTFAVLTTPQDAITSANRFTLAPNGHGTYQCGGFVCYVAFAVGGGLQARTVARGHAYRFQYVGNRLDLYQIGG